MADHKFGSAGSGGARGDVVMTRVMVEIQPRPPAGGVPGTAGPRSVPHRPRLSARLAYLMQKVLKPNAVNRRFGAVVERSPTARKMFTAAERASKERLFGCRMCGQCALPVTGYSCPMGCPKELRNGPCGGVGPGGACEVYPTMKCVWVVGFERAASQGAAADLRLMQRPIDHRRWGESSWLNYWAGRDDNLWTDDDGEAI
ncbi:MAG TPA: methylenetetrahydrofolate reductase C-terminal domain-containing protein [Trebonia sp.]|nr:methylenetetrahydrofolate reductase C-terminal domain-containing protein [Trebonia sp.]